MQHMDTNRLSTRETNLNNSKMDNISDVLIVIAIFGSIGTVMFQITKTLTNYYLRKKMVEKGLIGDDAVKILTSEQSKINNYSNLKWGLIILTSGIGFVIIDQLNANMNDGTLPFGIFAICVSIGFLAYYFIMKGITDKK